MSDTRNKCRRLHVDSRAQQAATGRYRTGRNEWCLLPRQARGWQDRIYFRLRFN